MTIEVNVLFLNMACPCAIRAEHLSAGMGLAQYCITDDAGALGLALLPVFSYKANNFWNETHAVMKHLTATTAHVDRSFFLQFREKCAGA